MTSADALIGLYNLAVGPQALWKLDLSGSRLGLMAIEPSGGPGTGSSGAEGSAAGPAAIRSGAIGWTRVTTYGLRIWVYDPAPEGLHAWFTEDLGRAAWEPLPGEWVRGVGEGLYEVWLPTSGPQGYVRFSGPVEEEQAGSDGKTNQ